MTRRHFQAIAETFRIERQMIAIHTPTHGGQRKAAFAALDSLARAIASDLAETNERFDRARFLAACGVGN